MFWAYDGGFRIGAPPRLYNQIMDDVIMDVVRSNDAVMLTGYQLVKMYAVVNMAIADAGIAVRALSTCAL